MRADYRQFYQRITAPFNRHPAAIRGLRLINSLVVWVMYLAYFLILLWLGVNNISKLWLFVVIPGAGFILLSIIRQRIDAPRPYEEWAITPLIKREKTGDSMPSRHVFSATIIAMCGIYLSYSWGTFLLVLAVISGITRIIGGVHYPRDVVVGFLCGIVCGVLLFLL